MSMRAARAIRRSCRWWSPPWPRRPASRWTTPTWASRSSSASPPKRRRFPRRPCVVASGLSAQPGDARRPSTTALIAGVVAESSSSAAYRHAAAPRPSQENHGPVHRLAHERHHLRTAAVLVSAGLTPLFGMMGVAQLRACLVLHARGLLRLHLAGRDRLLACSWSRHRSWSDSSASRSSASSCAGSITMGTRTSCC